MLAMHETDYTLPEDRSVTIPPCWITCSTSIRPKRSWIRVTRTPAAAMPQLLEKVGAARLGALCRTPRGVPQKVPAAGFRHDYKLRRAETPNGNISAISCRWTAARRASSGRWIRGAERQSSRCLPWRILIRFPSSIHIYGRSEEYSFEAVGSLLTNFKMRRRKHLLDGLQPKPTSMGINHHWIGRVSQQLGADLYLGPIYTWGAVGGRTDFYA